MYVNKEINSGKNHNVGLGMAKFQGILHWYLDIPVIDMELSLVHEGKILKQTKTNAEGQFKFEGIFPKDSLVEFHQINVNNDRLIYIKVLQSNGKPARDVSVKLVELGKEKYMISDKRGIVKIDKLTDKFYNVMLNGKWIKIPTIVEDEFDDSVEPESILLNNYTLFDTIPFDEEYEGEYEYDPDRED